MKTVKIDSNYKNILGMLTGPQFYDSDDSFLRELIANAYDACYTRQALEWSWGAEFLEMEEAENLNAVRKSFDAKVIISFNSETGMLFVEDNGVGINGYDIENYVAKVGTSYYQSQQFKMQRLNYNPIGQFGVGLCSCFRVSRAILIESKKDKSINTAWNVMDRQDLEPIAAKWFKDSQTIEYVTSNRTLTGTRITLALSSQYAKSLTLERMVQQIMHFMAFQKIPIEIYYNDRKVVLYNPKMKVAPSSYVAGVTTLVIDNELLEGYITIYNSKHKHLVSEPELFQQGFRVTEDAKGLNLKPEWLRHMSFQLNIKRRFLHMKLNREGVALDERYHQLREAIGQLVVGYFSKNPLGLSQYLADGQKRILTPYENEMKLLEQSGFIDIYLKGQEHELTMGTVIGGFKGQRIRVAYISKALFEYFKEHYYVDFKNFLSKYNLIVFEKNREMFTQLLSPYMKAYQYVLTEMPGIVYTELVVDISEEKNASAFRKKYQLYPEPAVSDLVFCFVSNEQKGPFQIVLNKSHPNVELLEKASVNPKVANLREVIIENIKQRIINARGHWDRVIDFGGSFVDEWNSPKEKSVQSIWCLETDFALSLNEFIESKLTQKERLAYGLEGLVFHKDDFIEWWYAPK